MRQQLFSFKNFSLPVRGAQSAGLPVHHVNTGRMIVLTFSYLATHATEHGKPTCSSRDFIVSSVAFLKKGLYIRTILLRIPASW